MGKFTKVIGIGLLLAAFNPANATFVISGGTAGSSPDDGNDVLDGSIDGWYGSELMLDGPASLIFEFIGSEAGYHNQFLLNDEVIFDNQAGSSLIGSTHTMNFEGGSLPFQFLVNTTGQSVMNGSNLDNSGGGVSTPNFFLSIIEDAMAASGNSVWLALDDGGAGPDNDYDDMFIRITNTAANVPEPGSLVLLSLGLIGLGVLRRRMKS